MPEPLIISICGPAGSGKSQLAKAVAARLGLPMGTQGTTPDVDFAAFQRRSDEGGYPFAVRPVMLVDAMAPYPASALVVLLEVPSEERVRRIIDRDARWGTRVADRLHHLDVTWRKASDGLRPDMVLDGTRPLAHLAADLAADIRRMGVDSKEQES